MSWSVRDKTTMVVGNMLHRVLTVLGISCILLLLNNAQLLAEDERSDRNFLYLPLIATGAPQVHSANKVECAANVQEARVGELLRTDAHQGRAMLTCDPVLAAVAREKARDMAQRSYFDHVDPDGLGPNYLIQQAGYRLPASYGQTLDANNVESIAAGFESAEGAWQGWLDSDHHRPHVLGEVSFFAEQTQYGIGYFHDPNSFYHHYWVILTAHSN